MRVTHVRVRNVLGIEQLDLRPGGFTVIRGQNATGKSSLLEAIKAAFGGGHDASLLRHGAKKGEVVLVLDDGTEIRKSITEGRSSLSVRDGEQREVAAPQAFLDMLVERSSFNPVAFLGASPKDRIRILLSALPVKLDRAQIDKVTSEASGLPFEIPDEINADSFGVIGFIRRRLFDERTGVNRAAKEKRSTAETIQRGLPPASELSTNWQETLAGLEKEQEEARGRELEFAKKVEREYSAEIILLDREEAKWVEETKSQYDGKIRDLEVQIEKLNDGKKEAIGKIKLEASKSREDAKRRREKLSTEFAEELSVRKVEIARGLAETKEKSASAVRAAEQRRFAASLWCDVEALEQRSGKLTAGLGQVDSLSASLLDSLPVPGLKVEDGDLTMHGIGFDRLSSSQRTWLAVEVAKAHPGRLGLVVCDGMELLDQETFAAFKDAFSKTELQAIVTRVSEDEKLTIETDENGDVMGSLKEKGSVT